MANLLRTEWYKLWHSWYFWGIGIFTFLLSSILLLDSKGKTSNLVMASLYNTPLLYFLIIVFIALFIGNDLGGRTLNAYLTAGHKRGYVFWAKVMVSQIGCILILTVPLLIHEIIGRFGMKERFPEISGTVCRNHHVCITGCSCFCFPRYGKNTGSFHGSVFSYDFFDEWATCRKSDKNIAHGTASINCITKV